MAVPGVVYEVVFEENRHLDFFSDKEMEGIVPRSKTEFTMSSIQNEEFDMFNFAPLGIQPSAQEPDSNQSSNALSFDQITASILEPAQFPVEDTIYSAPSLCPAPLCRQFWKAGNYNEAFISKSHVPSSKNSLHVHPKFLHSNATSHKWAFGAVAELLDNAIDETQDGATFVYIDKNSNPRDQSPALLIQDDGGGMDPVTLRRCMSFGFSDKISKSAIGRYGNGFKTGTMRLGADVIVFSRRISDERTLTQSIGLLSYTYLLCTGLDRIVVPTIDYEYIISTGTFQPSYHNGKENFQLNISTILQWSPYLTEAELLKQFDDIGYHGTKIIIFNLWFNDDGTLELNFDSDTEDIRLQGLSYLGKLNSKMLASEQHIGNQYHYSLRMYLSILYLQHPENFNIVLRGKVVEHHSIARDLKFPEFIVYRPQTGEMKEGEIITTIGFLKEAPQVNINGFNVYHKNRLILPFWQVLRYGNSRGRGVVGVLEANFVEPTHNKQDFERTSLFQKLETRLREMTLEYWDHHCGLIGYLPSKETRIPLSSKASSYDGSKTAELEPFGLGLADQTDPLTNLPAGCAIENCRSNSQDSGTKRTHDSLLSAFRRRRQARIVPDASSAANCMEVERASYAANQRNEHEAVVLMQENKKLQAKCLELEKREEELNLKVLQLKSNLEEGRNEYGRMLTELLKYVVV